MRGWRIAGIVALGVAAGIVAVTRGIGLPGDWADDIDWYGLGTGV